MPTVNPAPIEQELNGASVLASGGYAEWPSDLPAPLQGRTHGYEYQSISTQFESGRLRNRPQFDTALELMDVTWNLTEDQFDTFKSFVEDDLENGTKHTILFGNDSSSVYGYPRQIWRVVALYPAGEYSFARMDNCFQVKAKLEVISQFYVEGDTSAASEQIGIGSPEGEVDAPPGTIYWDKLNKVQYVKEKGICSTGWREQYGGGVES